MSERSFGDQSNWDSGAERLDYLTDPPSSGEQSDSHRCPVGGCAKQVPDHMLMCGRHWRMVHPNLQRRLYAAWARGAGAGTEAHAEAMRECVDEVDWKVGAEAKP